MPAPIQGLSDKAFSLLVSDKCRQEPGAKLPLNVDADSLRNGHEGFCKHRVAGAVCSDSNHSLAYTCQTIKLCCVQR